MSQSERGGAALGIAVGDQGCEEGQDVGSRVLREELEGAEGDGARRVVDGERRDQVRFALLLEDAERRVGLARVAAPERDQEELDGRQVELRERDGASEAVAAKLPPKEVEVASGDAAEPEIQSTASSATTTASTRGPAPSAIAKRMPADATACAPRCPTNSTSRLSARRAGSGSGRNNTSSRSAAPCSGAFRRSP